jgi:hypothetical protein
MRFCPLQMKKALVLGPTIDCGLTYPTHSVSTYENLEFLCKNVGGDMFMQSWGICQTPSGSNTPLAWMRILVSIQQMTVSTVQVDSVWSCLTRSHKKLLCSCSCSLHSSPGSPNQPLNRWPRLTDCRLPGGFLRPTELPRKIFERRTSKHQFQNRKF